MVEVLAVEALARTAPFRAAAQVAAQPQRLPVRLDLSARSATVTVAAVVAAHSMGTAALAAQDTSVAAVEVVVVLR